MTKAGNAVLLLAFFVINTLHLENCSFSKFVYHDGTKVLQ